ncbi:hypothetical protein GGR54DRAFT_636381 [Hypoxylon sp. NC1633]|nr:hypothetical protein GGR54DRAFT_636381 [Hypoxylon sp. NC1633]
MRSLVTPVLLAGLAAAQNTTITAAPPQTIINLFLGSRRESNYSFAGSVIAVDETATTYEIRCSSGALNLPGFPTTTCDLKDPPWTVTEGPATMVGVLTTAIETVSAVLDEKCVVEGHTAAYCNYTYVGNSAGQTTSTTYTTIITGDNYAEYPITITAGAEKLTTVTETSPANTTAAAPVPYSTSGIGINVAKMRALGVVVLAAIGFVI